MDEHKPDIHFIGIGAPRCGTSWLSRQFKEHSKLCLSLPKETHFFDRPQNRERGFSHYSSHYDHCSPGQLKGEFTTSYFLSDDVLEDIAKQYPETKLIVMLRDPAERAFSNYMHNKLRNGYQHMFRDELDNEKGEIFTAGYYHRHLQNVFKHFQREQVLIIFYEDVVNKPEEVIKNVYAFLGVQHESEPELLTEKVNAHQDHYAKSVTLNRFLKNFKFQVLHGRLRFLHNIMKGSFLSRIFHHVLYGNRSADQNHKSIETLQSSERAELIDRYREDTIALEKLLDKDLSHWYQT